MPKKRDLTPEEERLWQQTMRDASKIKQKKAVAALPPAPPKLRVDRRKGVPAFEVPANSSALPPIERGEYAGVDHHTADRFRKGEYPIDATLDLHGMNRDRALRSLTAFLQKHYTRGSRCLLVVTGKGMAKNADSNVDRGILREMLPGWLDEPQLRPMVLAFDTARAHHGGKGAYYVLLKRKR